MPHSKSNHSSPSSEDTAPADIPHLLATCCADVTSVSSSNFIRAFRFLPPAKTAALVKVYAFCRIMDDCVDEPTSQTHKQQALDYWHEQTRQMFARQPAHPVMAELRKVIDEYKIPQEYFLGIIHGCAQDIVKTRYQTYPELLDYCYHVASLVGLICMKIFGYVTPNAEKVAIDLGMAFQLTNIMRDLGEDYLKGRVYLAQEDLRQALYTEEDLKNKTENQALKQLLMLYHNRALAYYQTAFEEFEKDEHNKLIAARIMAKTYFKILQKMRRRGFRVLYKRVSLNFFEKAWIMLSFSCKRGERAQGIRLKAHGLQPTANCQRPESDCQPLAVSCQPISSPVPRPSSLVRRSSALIVGGGVAGLYAAVLLDSLGYKVTLVEQKPILGGRAFSFTDKITGATVDNGQHLLMGAYHETLAFLEAIGAKHTMQFAIPSRIPLWSRDHKINQFTLGTWPPPFNLAKAVLGFWGMSLREKCGLVKMSGTIRKYPTQPSPNNQTAREWLKQFSQQETALANFWEIFTLATLNSTIDQAPAENLLQVLSHCFFAGRRDGFLVFPQQGLSDCFAHPAQRYLTL
ncbi:MAG TPA: FAD-dependent oxidoreductase, partial [bacterium]|nr:FAD-dependent oxidoreductase [bacterium]